MVKSLKPLQEVSELLERADRALQRTGFSLQKVSRVTEARYYEWPGCCGLLRLAGHRLNDVPIGHSPVISKLTFGSSGGLPGELRISDEAVGNMVAMAIGRFFMRAAELSDNRSPAKPADRAVEALMAKLEDA